MLGPRVRRDRSLAVGENVGNGAHLSSVPAGSVAVEARSPVEGLVKSSEGATATIREKAKPSLSYHRSPADVGTGSNLSVRKGIGIGAHRASGPLGNRPGKTPETDPRCQRRAAARVGSAGLFFLEDQRDHGEYGCRLVGRSPATYLDAVRH